MAGTGRVLVSTEPDQIEELLQSLLILGSARLVDGDKFVAA